MRRAAAIRKSQGKPTRKPTRANIGSAKSQAWFAKKPSKAKESQGKPRKANKSQGVLRFLDFRAGTWRRHFGADLSNVRGMFTDVDECSRLLTVDG